MPFQPAAASESDRQKTSIPRALVLVNQTAGAGEAVKRQDNMTWGDPAESRYTLQIIYLGQNTGDRAYLLH